MFKGQGTGIGPANNAKFYDKEWLTCDNSTTSRFFGRCYVTTTLFQNGLQGSFVSSDIFISWSDDGGRTWTNPRSIAVTHPSCTFQTTGPAESRACDENQFSIPETARERRPVHPLPELPERGCVGGRLRLRLADPGHPLDRWRRDVRARRAGGPARGRAQRHAVVGDRQADDLGPSDPLGVGRATSR